MIITYSTQEPHVSNREENEGSRGRCGRKSTETAEGTNDFTVCGRMQMLAVQELSENVPAS